MADNNQTLETTTDQQFTEEEVAALQSNTTLGSDSGILNELTEMFSDNRAEDVTNILDLASDHPDVADDEGVQQLIDLKRKKLEEKAAAAGEITTEEEEEETEEEETDAVEEAEDGTVKVKRDPFTKPETKVKSIEPAKLTEEISKVLNIKVTDGLSAGKVLKTINKFRADSEKLSEVSTEFTEYKEFFATLPKPLIAGILAFAKKQDWQSAIGNAPSVIIDYNADFDTLADDKKLSMVNSYLGEGTFKEFKDVPAASLNATKNIFNKEKQLHQTEIETQKQQSATEKREFDAALKSSIDSMKVDFTDFDARLITNMAKKIESGEWTKYFVGKDGKPTKEAVKRLTLAIVAEDKIKSLEAQIASLTGSKKRVEKVTKEAPNQKQTKSRGNNQIQLPDELAKQLKGLGDLQNASKSVY